MTKDRERDDVQRYYNRCRSEEIAAGKEHDDALIAEKRKLSDVLEAITRLGTVDPWRDDLLRAAAILRGDERPKPDRAKMLADELDTASIELGWVSRDAAITIIRRHFDKLRSLACVANLILSGIQWPKEKPPALITIDDRALQFTGKWSDFAIDDLRTFKPWNKP